MRKVYLIKDLNDFGNREYGAPYLDDITKQAILEKIDRYTVNGDVANKSITTEMLYDGTVKWNTTINWDEKWDKPLGVKNYGLNISRGATDYAEAGTYEWHLDGYLEIDYKYIVNHILLNEDGDKVYSDPIPGFVAYSKDELGTVVLANNQEKREYPGYEYAYATPEQITLDGKKQERW